MRVFASNRREMIIVNELDLSLATRKYARESLQQPRILAAHWRRMLPELRQRVARDRSHVPSLVRSGRRGFPITIEQRHHGVQLGGRGVRVCF